MSIGLGSSDQGRDRELLIKFRGSLADHHKIPAYNAGKSIAGISRSLLIPSIYLEDGRVRHRNLSRTKAIQLNMVAQRPGSFESVLEFLIKPEMMAAYLVSLGAALSADFVRDFTYSMIRRCIGKTASPEVEKYETNGVISAGDTAAIVDAIEPAMREAHTVVGAGASSVVIVNGNGNKIVLNAGTKAYVNASVDDDRITAKEFSIASFNANTSNGRAFDYEAGHTVAFVLDDSVDGSSINAVTESMRRYTHRRRLESEMAPRLYLNYSATRAPDGRIKKIRIFSARMAEE